MDVKWVTPRKKPARRDNATVCGEVDATDGRLAAGQILGEGTGRTALPEGKCEAAMGVAIRSASKRRRRLCAGPGGGESAITYSRREGQWLRPRRDKAV